MRRPFSEAGAVANSGTVADARTIRGKLTGTLTGTRSVANPRTVCGKLAWAIRDTGTVRRQLTRTVARSGTIGG